MDKKEPIGKKDIEIGIKYFRYFLYFLGGLIILFLGMRKAYCFGITLDSHLPNKEEIIEHCKEHIYQERLNKEEQRQQEIDEKNWVKEYGGHLYGERETFCNGTVERNRED